MTHKQLHDFQQRFPGPYAYRHGTDGVDLTLDVFCQATDDHIISSTYWVDLQHAEMIAMVLVLALEFIRSAHSPFPLADHVTVACSEFFTMYPAPYVTREFAHGWVGAEIGPASQSTDALIVSFLTNRCNPQSHADSDYLCDALNRLFRTLNP